MLILPLLCMWNIGAVDRIDETEAIEMSQPKTETETETENSRKDKYFIRKLNWGTCGRIRLCLKSRRLITLMAHKTSERVFCMCDLKIQHFVLNSPHKFRKRKLKQINYVFLWVYLAVLVGWVIYVMIYVTYIYMLSSPLMNSYKRSYQEQYVERLRQSHLSKCLSYFDCFTLTLDLEIKNPLQSKYINIEIYLILSKGWKTDLQSQSEYFSTRKYTRKIFISTRKKADIGDLMVTSFRQYLRLSVAQTERVKVVEFGHSGGCEPLHMITVS